MTPFRAFALFALSAGLCLAAGASPRQSPPRGEPKVIPFPGEQKVIRIPAQPLPGQPVVVGGELPVVPKSSAAFFSVKVSDLVDHADLKPVLEQLRKTPDALDGIVELVGVQPREIDRVTLFWPTLGGDRWLGQPVLVVTTRAAYNEARLLKSLSAEPVFNDGPRGHGARGPVEFKSSPPVMTTVEPSTIKVPPLDLNPPKYDLPPKLETRPPAEDDTCSSTVVAGFAAGEPLFYELQRGPFSLLLLIDERTLVFLPEDFDRGSTHLALLTQLLQRKTTGPLAEAIAAGAAHTIAAGIHLPPLFRAFDRGLPAELAPYAALLPARTGVLTGDLVRSAKLTLTLTFGDAAAARRAGPVLEEGLKVLAVKAGKAAADMKESRQAREKALAPLVELFASGLRNATVKAGGSAVVASTDVEVGPAAGKAVAEFLQSLASQKKVAGRLNNLKQIGLALHNYQDVYGKLPANIYNAKGDAILSWRVQLLPYLEQDNLYKQFKLDEPWDSENNKKLIDSLPRVFEVPGRVVPKGKTYFQGFISPRRDLPRLPGDKRPFGEAWLVQGDRTGRSLVQIPDGTSNTIAVVEARDAVIWSKPDDLPFGEKLPALGEAGVDRFAVLMFDGSVAHAPDEPGCLHPESTHHHQRRRGDSGPRRPPPAPLPRWVQRAARRGPA